MNHTHYSGIPLTFIVALGTRDLVLYRGPLGGGGIGVVVIHLTLG